MNPYFKRSTFKIQPHELKIQLKTKELSGLRFVHISDLHVDEKTKYDELEYLSDIINTISCDFVLFTGDFIDCQVHKIESKLQILKKIKHQCYFVSGNHDLVYGYESLQNLLQECGFISLENKYEKLFYGKKEFVLWGLSDRFSKFFTIKRDEKRLTTIIAKLPHTKIFAAHQPKDFTYGLQTKSSLFLAGHTHGGQIFPFGYIVRLFQPFIKGLHFKDSMAIYVNQGLGAWGLKYRYLSKAEITIIEVE